jgi:protein gp37
MTKIEWATQTINPIIGCSKVSPACDNCYAEVMARRLAGMKHTKEYGQVITDSRWNGKTIFRPKELLKPAQWKKPQRIFVVSMGDMFHESVPFEWIDQIIDMIFKNPDHTFIILTKRPEKALEYFKGLYDNPFCKPLPNLWMGVTVENQYQADKRIPILLQIPAAKHFVSCEPLLGSIDLTSIKGNAGSVYQVLKPIENFGDSNRPALDWVIAGAETGAKARIMHTWQAESLFDQCRAANVPFFLKKVSNWAGETIPDRMLKEDLRQFPL